MFKALQFLKELTVPSPVDIPEEASLFFETEQKYLAYCQKVQVVNLELFLAKSLLEHLENNPSESYEKDLVDEEIKSLKAKVISLEQKIENCHRLISLESCSMKTLLHLVNDPIYKEQAQEKLQAYRERMLQALKHTGSNMTRLDLLEHLVGPKNDLLAYYGYEVEMHIDKQKIYNLQNEYVWLYPDGPSQEQNIEREQMYQNLVRYPSIYTIVNLNISTPLGGHIYYLENDGPKHLEDELRYDLEANGFNLDMYPPLIANYEVTAPINPEAIKLSRQLASIIDNWQNSSEDEQLYAINQLKKFNGWDFLDEETKDFPDKFVISFDSSQAGTVRLGKREKKFTMDMNKMLFIIPQDEKQLFANKYTSLDVVKAMVEEYRRFGLSN